MIERFGRAALTMMVVVALAFVWLVYSLRVNFENWPWTVRDIYREGSFEGVTIGSRKADVMEQILARQREGALDSVAFIDDTRVLSAQERAGGPLTAEAAERIRRADHWHMYSPCRAHVMKPICSMDLYFSDDRLLRIVYETYFGPTDLP